MLAEPENATLRLALLVVIAGGGLAAALLISRRSAWPPAGPLALIAATPLIPSLPVAYGLSTDDVLPVVGALTCLLVVDRRTASLIGWPRALAVGAALMCIAGLIASVSNADGPVQGFQMTLKAVGHIALLALVGTSVALTLPVERRRGFVARAIAIVATAEAAFGLIAWVLPLPGNAGLEASRHMTALLDRVAGRIAGTTGLSPNFLGAIFVLSLPLTVALALRATDRRGQMVWWAAASAQLLALSLTFTRTSLVIAIAILAILLLARGRARALLVLGVLVAVVAVMTPLAGRLLGDSNDRAALWTSAIRMMLDHPLTGVGPGRMLVAAALDPERYQITAFGMATNNAHNTILLPGAETGMLGALGSLLVNLSIAAGAVAVLIVAARRARSGQASSERTPGEDLTSAAALGILGFLVQGMTNNLFAVQVTSVMAMLVFSTFLLPGSSLLSALRRGADAPSRRRSSSAYSPSDP